MKKIYFLLVFILLVICFDFVLSKTDIPINQNNYLMGFEKFRDHAYKTRGEKRIILLGGSSLGWGVSAKELTSNLDLLVLNSGIHAGVGFRNFIRNVESVVDKQFDTLVISPEYTAISDSRFLRSDDFCEVALYVRRDYTADCIGYSLAKVFKVAPLLMASEVYRRDGFNLYGDYTYRIDAINMVGKMQDRDICGMFDISDLENNYIPYIKNLQDLGYRILYIPNFSPEAACSQKEKIIEFHTILHENFGIKGFEDVQLLFDEKYFYNTTYHLTSEGVSMKTAIFLGHLKQYFIDK